MNSSWDTLSSGKQELGFRVYDLGFRREWRITWETACLGFNSNILKNDPYLLHSLLEFHRFCSKRVILG